jgi:cobalt/nickel transport system permease protein
LKDANPKRQRGSGLPSLALRVGVRPVAMTLALAHFEVPDSALARLDPRWKIAGLVPAAAAAAALHGLLPCLAALAAALALVLLARLPARWYLARLGAVALFVGLFAAALPFLPGGRGPTWEVGPLWVSVPGLEAAARLCLKAAAVLTFVLVLWATAPPAETFKAAHALRVPGLVVQLLVLTYRYLFLLAGEFGRLRTALRVRGYRNRLSLHTYRTVGHVAGTLLVRGAERAERVGQALRCRGFDGRFRSLSEPHTGPADVLFFALAVAGAAGLLTWDLAQR